MKILKYIEIKNSEGGVLLEGNTKKPFNTPNMIEIGFGGSRFESVGEQWSAYDIIQKIKGMSDEIEVEDAEFNLIKKYMEKFPTYQTGFIFIPFLELFK